MSPGIGAAPPQVATIDRMKLAPRGHALLGAAAASLCYFALLLFSSAWLPIVWDEGDTIARAELLASGDWGTPDQPWPYTTVREGHPPLSGWLIAGGLKIAPRWLSPLTQARFGPMLLFALAAGAMFYRLERDYGVWQIGVMAMAVLITMPRLFAHAHFATLDGPLTACWVLAWATFAPACRDWRSAPLFGVALGLTLTAKFTGWLAPLPFLAWALLYRRTDALRALAIGLPVALAVFVTFNPPLWHDLSDGMRTFFALNLERASRPGHNISTQFFGQMYNLDHSLPWYNTLVWTAITISPMSLLFGGVGIVSTVRRWRTDPISMLLVLQWATLIVVRAFPGTPPHDAERLILPSFAFFAALAGVGIGRSLYRESLLLPDKIIAQGWAKVGMMIAVTASTFDALGYFPHNLSYYNRLTGGVRGATALGMEPTYYWDSLDQQVLTWLDEHTGPTEKVAFGSAPPRNLELLHRWGLLKKLPGDEGTFRWYVIQRRPSGYRPQDAWLIEHATPAFERSVKGVPLLEVYAYEDFERATEATKPQASP